MGGGGGGGGEVEGAAASWDPEGQSATWQQSVLGMCCMSMGLHSAEHIRHCMIYVHFRRGGLP